MSLYMFPCIACNNAIFARPSAYLCVGCDQAATLDVGCHGDAHGVHVSERRAPPVLYDALHLQGEVGLPVDQDRLHVGVLLRRHGQLQRKEGSVLFNDALNTFSYGYMASGLQGK